MKETENIYFLCSKAVVEHFPKMIKSKPFKSGYRFDLDNYFIAHLPFKEIEKYYNEIIEPYNKKSNVEIDFWCKECTAGSMDVSSITLSGAKRKGLFVEIENKIGLTTMYNRAMVVFNLSQKYNCNPIELISKILK